MVDNRHRKKGSGDRPFAETADHLNNACLAIEAIDYNVPTPDDLRTLLLVRETIQEATLKYRRRQHASERRQGDGEGDGD